MIDKNLLRLLGENRKYIPVIVLMMLLGLLCNIGITGCICWALTIVVTGSAMKAFALPFITAVLLVGCRYGLSYAVGIQKDRLGREAKKELRNRLYEKIVKLGVKTNDEMSMAGLTQVSMEGVEQLDLYYSSYIPQFFYAMLAPVVLFLVTVWIEWRVALILLLCVPLIPISIILVSKGAHHTFAKYWDKYTMMGDHFLDSVQGLKELKIFRADASRHEKMNENAEEFRKITMKVLVMQLVSTTTMDLVAYSGAALGIAVAVLSMLYWNLAPISALFLILVAVEFFLPLRAFGSAFHIAMNGASAGKKMLQLLETPEPKWGDEAVEDTDLKLKDVTFAYEEGRDVLKDIHMEFPKVGMTAIVGESGCGKSTIVNLLLGVISPDTGTITMGGKPISSFNREDYYRKIGTVSYNTYLFHTTVRENFRLAKADVTDEEMYEALEQVNLADFIRQNGGLEKEIREDAENLSGGQKQRLTLAIQLVSEKDVYIFDEATSNIDVESEKIIMDSIQKLSKRKSVIVISHRLANVKDADRIYYLKAGRVTEEGCHEALMTKAGGYAGLYRAQKKLEQGYLEVE